MGDDQERLLAALEAKKAAWDAFIAASKEVKALKEGAATQEGALATGTVDNARRARVEAAGPSSASGSGEVGRSPRSSLWRTLLGMLLYQSMLAVKDGPEQGGLAESEGVEGPVAGSKIGFPWMLVEWPRLRLPNNKPRSRRPEGELPGENNPRSCIWTFETLPLSEYPSHVHLSEKPSRLAPRLPSRGLGAFPGVRLGKPLP